MTLSAHCYDQTADFRKRVSRNGLASIWRLTVTVFAVEVVGKFKNYSVSVTSSVTDEVNVASRQIQLAFFGCEP